MSSLKYLSSAPSNNVPGDATWDTKQTSYEWVSFNGAIVSQASNPQLYAKIGLLPNGLNTWTARTVPVSNVANSLLYGGSIYVCGTDVGNIATSTDAITWTSRNSGSPSSAPIRVQIYAGGLWVYGGNNMVGRSTTGTSWSGQNVGGTTINGLAYGNSIYVYAGSNGTVATSVDTFTWTAQTSGTSSLIYSLIYGNSLFVYAGAGGVLATSTDAITWTARTSGTVSDIRSLVYANNLYVYGTNGGGLATSTDAITWTARTSGTTSSILFLIYGNGIYVYAGAGGVLATSTDAITWYPKTSGTNSNFAALIYGNSLYVYGSNASNSVSTAQQYSYNTATDFALPICQPTSTALSPTITVYAKNG